MKVENVVATDHIEQFEPRFANKEDLVDVAIWVDNVVYFSIGKNSRNFRFVVYAQNFSQSPLGGNHQTFA